MLGGVEQLGVEFLRGEDGLAGGDGLLGERRLQVAGAQIVVELRAVAVAGLGEVERGVAAAGVGEHVQVLRRGEVGVVGFESGLVGGARGLVGVGRGRVGEGCGPVDQGVGEGVVGDGVAVEADRLTQHVRGGDAVLDGPVDGGGDGGPVRVLDQLCCGGRAEVGAQLGQPCGTQRVGGRGAGVGAQDGGAGVPGDPPPHRGGLVLVRERPFGGRGA